MSRMSLEDMLPFCNVKMESPKPTIEEKKRRISTWIGIVAVVIFVSAIGVEQFRKTLVERSEAARIVEIQEKASKPIVMPRYETHGWKFWKWKN